MTEELDPKVRAELRALARLISQQDEKIAALSRARQLDVSSIPVTVEDDEGVQETVDVPLNVGVSQGVHALGVANDAAERVDEAQEAADGAAADALAASQAAADAAIKAQEAMDALERAVVDSVIEYAVSESDTVPPTEGWSTDNPTPGEGEFVWMRTVITYADETTATSDPVLMSRGGGGLTVESIKPFYALASDTPPITVPTVPTTLEPSSPWLQGPPVYVAGMVLFVSDRIVYSDGSFVYMPARAVPDWKIAGEALAEAEATRFLAEGLYQTIPSETAPTTSPTGALKQGDQWWVMGATGSELEGKFVGVQVWDGTQWQPRQLVADSVLVPGSVSPVLIEDGGVTASKLAVDALDFKTANGLEISGGLVKGSRFEGGHFSLSDSITTYWLPEKWEHPFWRENDATSEIVFSAVPYRATGGLTFHAGATGEGSHATFNRVFSRYSPQQWHFIDPTPYLDGLLPLWSRITRIYYRAEYSGSNVEDVTVYAYGRDSNETTSTRQLTEHMPGEEFIGFWEFQWDPSPDLDIHFISFSVPRGETLTIFSEYIEFEGVSGESLQWGKDQESAYPGLRAYHEDQSLHYEILPSGIKFWDKITGEPTMIEAVDGGLSLTASPAMIAAGTDDSHYVTPAGLAGRVPKIAAGVADIQPPAGGGTDKAWIYFPEAGFTTPPTVFVVPRSGAGYTVTVNTWSENITTTQAQVGASRSNGTGMQLSWLAIGY